MNYIKKFQRENKLYPDGIIGVDTMRTMMIVFNIKYKTDIAHFLGQIAEETADFTKSKESMYYSAEALRRIFPRYFRTEEEARVAAYRPELIANRVYNDKFRVAPLGNVGIGDGFRFIGRGSIQITGRKNYELFSEYIKEPAILYNPDLVSDLYFWETALWYFNYYNVWKHTKLITTRAIKKTTLAVNGGCNGLAHRDALTRHFYQIAKQIKL